MKAEILLDLIRNNAAIPLHIMSKEAYSKAHIPGSVWIPINRIEQHFFEGLDRKKLIVPYCKNSSCMSSKIAADILAENGFIVERYEGGIEEWLALDFPVEHSD